MACSVGTPWVGESSIMTRSRRRPVLLSLMLALLIMLHFDVAKPASALSHDYYVGVCPLLESIVRNGVIAAHATDPRIYASLVRLHFHDCIVDGCDGSNLLKDTPTFSGEQSALPNANSARGYNVIDNIKAAVELVCPKTVSCADILTLAARDSVVLAGGPNWPVNLGRYDSLTASKANANADIPSPASNFNTLVAMFAAVGLSESDLVALSGAHTFGRARCITVISRLYNFGGTGKPDPEMDPTFLKKLQTACPNGGNGNVLNNLDVSTPDIFDNAYYLNLLALKGYLNSDQVLEYQSLTARAAVTLYAFSQPIWFNDFVVSIIKMGNIGLKGPANGEIRVNCGFPNAG